MAHLLHQSFENSEFWKIQNFQKMFGKISENFPKVHSSNDTTHPRFIQSLRTYQDNNTLVKIISTLNSTHNIFWFELLNLYNTWLSTYLFSRSLCPKPIRLHDIVIVTQNERGYYTSKIIARTIFFFVKNIHMKACTNHNMQLK